MVKMWLTVATSITAEDVGEYNGYDPATMSEFIMDLDYVMADPDFTRELIERLRRTLP